MIENVTCIRFYEKTARDSTFLLFVNDVGCYSMVNSFSIYIIEIINNILTVYLKYVKDRYEE